VTAHDGDDPQASPAAAPGIPVVSTGTRARFLGRALLESPQSPVHGRASPAVPTLKLEPAVSLGPQYPDSPTVRTILNRYQLEVAGEDLLSQVPRAPLQGNWYVGSAACATCHSKAYFTWGHSAHTHAYSELIRVGHSRDPDCVSCHVVGLNRVGGFTSFEKTPLLAEVGCETCHGPQGQHTVGKGPTPEHLDRAMCESCHNPDQSPHFNAVAYWAKIAH